MELRENYYSGLSADYSKPGLVSEEMTKKLIEDGLLFGRMKEASLPDVGPDYKLKQIETENKEWWPTHCEALRQGNAQILSDEYRDELVYFCQDGPFYGREEGTEIEASWWKLLSQPGVTMCWPIVMFYGEVIYSEWKCVDDVTNETTAKGNLTFLRRGHRGGLWVKTEQLTFYRDVNRKFFERK